MASRDWGPYHGVDWDLPSDPFDVSGWVDLLWTFCPEVIRQRHRELVGLADFPANEADFYEDHFEGNEGTGDFGFAETFKLQDFADEMDRTVKRMAREAALPKLYINVEPNHSPADPVTLSQLQQWQNQTWHRRLPYYTEPSEPWRLPYHPASYLEDHIIRSEN